MEQTLPKPKKKFVGAFDDTMLQELNEMKTRYANTFLFLQKEPDSPKELVEITEITESGVVLRSPHSGMSVLTPKTSAELSVEWPRYGFFNHNGGLYYVCRLPDRQYRRAPSHKNLVIQNIYSSIYGPPCGWGYDEIASAFEDRPFIPLKVALDMLKDSSVYGVALTDEFGITEHTAKKKNNPYLFWYMGSPIGEIVPDKHRIVVRYEPVKQEVSDFIRDFEGNTWKL